MAIKYLDIETLGLNYKEDMIIGIMVGDLENNKCIRYTLDKYKTEQELLKVFLSENDLFGMIWNFIPIGMNISFDLTFLYYRCTKYHLIKGLDFIYWTFEKPKIDIKYCLIIANNMQFKGASLSNFSTKQGKGSDVIEFYKNNDWLSIYKYQDGEYKAFMDVLKKIKMKLVNLNAIKKR